MQGQQNQPNPSLVELRSIRNEMSDLKTELSGLRGDIKKLNLVDQVAKGVALANVFLLVVFGFLAMLFGRG